MDHMYNSQNNSSQFNPGDDLCVKHLDIIENVLMIVKPLVKVCLKCKGENRQTFWQFYI